MEFVGTQRRAYAQLKSKSKKTTFIDSMCQAFGFERKYATKLLTGNRKYKAPKGRGKTYSDRATGLLKRVWYATGCMCTKYLKAIIVQALANLAELEHVDDALSREVASMSASTMDRALRGLERRGPGSVRKNRRSGKNDNAHVEQKNGSIVRGLFGEVRVDVFELRSQLASACAEWSDYFNYCRPCIMITQRAKKDKAKGFGKRYDKPRLPAQRVLDENVVSYAREAQIKTRIEKTNGIELYRFVLRRWSRILRKQRATETGQVPTRTSDSETTMAVCK